MTPVSTVEVIEQLVQLTHDASDVRAQHFYRQSLQVLVELAKAEQKREMMAGPELRSRTAPGSTLH